MSVYALEVEPFETIEGLIYREGLEELGSVLDMGEAAPLTPSHTEDPEELVYREARITADVLKSEAAQKLDTILRKKKGKVSGLKWALMQVFAGAAIVAYAYLLHPQMLVEQAGFKAADRKLKIFKTQVIKEGGFFVTYATPFLKVLAGAERAIRMLGIFIFPLYGIVIALGALANFLIAKVLALLIRDPEITQWSKAFLPINAPLRMLVNLLKLGVVSVKYVLSAVKKALGLVKNPKKEGAEISLEQFEQTLLLEYDEFDEEERRHRVPKKESFFAKLFSFKVFAVLVFMGIMFGVIIYLVGRSRGALIEAEAEAAAKQAAEEVKEDAGFVIKVAGKVEDAVKKGAGMLGGLFKGGGKLVWNLSVVGPVAKDLYKGAEIRVEAEQKLVKLLRDMGIRVEEIKIDPNTKQLIIKVKKGFGKLDPKFPKQYAKTRTKARFRRFVRAIKLDKVLGVGNAASAKALSAVVAAFA